MTSSFLVGVDVGTTRIKAVLLDLAGHEFDKAAVPTPWERVPGGQDLDPVQVRDIVRTLVRSVADGAAGRGGRVVGIGTTGMGEAGVAVDAAGTPLAPIRAWFDQRADVRTVLDAIGADAFARAVGMPLDAQPSLPKLLALRAELPAMARAVRFYSVPEWAVVALGGAPGSEVSLASRTGLLDIATGHSWPEAAFLLGRDLLGEPVPAGAVAGRATAAGVEGAALTVGGHDHQVAALVAGAARDGMLFDSLGTAEAIMRFTSTTPGPDLAAAAVAEFLTLGRTVVDGHACLLGGLRTGFGLERVANALGLTRRAERAEVAQQALNLGGAHLASVRIEGEHVVLELADGVTPAHVWRAAVDDLVAASGPVIATMERLVGPHLGAVAIGGWMSNPALAQAKAAQLPGLRALRLQEAGAAGAAYLAGVAAGLLPAAQDLTGPPWPVADDVVAGGAVGALGPPQRSNRREQGKRHLMSKIELDAIADAEGRFAVLAMDQRATLRRMLTAAGKPAEDADLSAFKVDVIAALSPLASGVLTDVEYGVSAVRSSGALADGVGLLIAAEPAAKQQWNGEQRTTVDPTRNAAWVRANTGDAMKFLVYWQPDRKPVTGEPDLAAEAMDAVRRVVEDCRAQGIPSVIEPLVTFPPGITPTQEQKFEAVILSAMRLATLRPDLLKLEWPGDAEGCKRVSDALGTVPWALLSAGVGYEQFVERCIVALDNGASGIIAGRAIWKEAVDLEGEQRRAFLREVAVPRMRGLVAVLAEHGRGWREVAAG